MGFKGLNLNTTDFLYPIIYDCSLRILVSRRSNINSEQRADELLWHITATALQQEF